MLHTTTLAAVLSALTLSPVPPTPQTPATQAPHSPPTTAAAVLPQPQWTILSQPLSPGDFFVGTFSTDLPYDLRFEITDLYVLSDRYEVYDNGVLVMTTPDKPDWDDAGFTDPFATPPFTWDPNAAFASGAFSAGTLDLAPGPHAIRIRAIHLPPSSPGGPPFADGSVAFRFVPACGPDGLATPATSRDTVPPQAGQIVPHTQDKVVIGAKPFATVESANVQFFPPNPGSTDLVAWAVSVQPDLVPAPPFGTFLIKVSSPDLLVIRFSLYTVTDLVTIGPIPNECSLIGQSIYTQGACLENNGGVVLTNALDYVIGVL